jgi:hypothetical protein
MRVSWLFLAMVALTGCGETTARQVLGFDRKAPDAFAVSPQAPLDVPQNLTYLPPPQPGLERPGQGRAELDAQSIIVGQYPVANRQVEAAPLDTESLRLRNEIDRQADEDADTQTKNWASWVVFWRDKPKPGVAVDAAAEARRIQENKAAGKPVTEGGTPVREDSGRLKLPKAIE